MADKLITIFGGSGFVGRDITKRLAAAGHTVRVAVRHPERVRFRSEETADRVQAVKADVTGDASVREAVQGAQAVINLVGIMNETGQQTFQSVHEGGARRVAAAARDAGAERMVQMSAIGASPESGSAYARSKAAGEQAAREAFPGATVVRPSIVFGPEDDFFNMFASMSKYLPALPLIGGGRTRFQPVYVGDVAAAYQAILDRPETAGQIYELGGPTVYTFRQLMELMMQHTGHKRVLVPIPFFLAEVQGSVLQRLPKPLLTRDQVELLKSDNVVGGTVPQLRDLDIVPTPLEDILPSYMAKYR
jgi:NADH dehydrogenase